MHRCFQHGTSILLRCGLCNGEEHLIGVTQPRRARRLPLYLAVPCCGCSKCSFCVRRVRLLQFLSRSPGLGDHDDPYLAGRLGSEIVLQASGTRAERAGEGWLPGPLESHVKPGTFPQEMDARSGMTRATAPKTCASSS